MSSGDSDFRSPLSASGAVYQAVTNADDETMQAADEDCIDARFIEGEGDDVSGEDYVESGDGTEMQFMRVAADARPEEGARRGDTGRQKKEKKRKKDSMHRSERMRKQVCSCACNMSPPAS